MNTPASNSVKSEVADGNNNNNQASTSKNSTPEEHFFTLLEIFPDICPTYLRSFLTLHDASLEAYTRTFLYGIYKKREVLTQRIEEEPLHFETQLATLVELFPDADSTFLQHHCQHFTNEPEAFNTFVADLFEKKNYPTKEQYLKKHITLPSINNIPLLQEIAYIKPKKEIKQEERHDKETKQTANEGWLLKTCECCFDDEVMPQDTIMCENAHLFCKGCVRYGCEVKVGEGKLNFPCLADCDQEFSLGILQSVLTPKVFSKLAQRKQMEEVKAAGIEDLEFCPFCDFAAIPVPGDKLFWCMNYDCMQESCRECKKPSHIPFRCDEVETDQDVQQRTYVENKMTEALLRKCHKCGLKFIKEGGCNKMKCSCGAMMCYVCQQPVKDFKHFKGQGRDRLCPLFSNTRKLHLNAIKRSAEDAKKELGLNKSLKHDPAKDIENHYKAGPSHKRSA